MIALCDSITKRKIRPVINSPSEDAGEWCENILFLLTVYRVCLKKPFSILGHQIDVIGNVNS